MRLLLTVLVFALAVPTVLVAAIALGPVIVGILCAVGFGLVVFAIVSLFLGLGAGAERAASRMTRH